MVRRVGMSLALLLLALPPSRAQPAPAEVSTAALAEQVAGIRKSLDQLVGLLQTVQHNQRVDLLLKRIELRERRLAPLERRLAAAQTEVEGIEGELTHIAAMKQQHERELDEIVREGIESDEGVRRALQEIEVMRTSMEARLEEAEARVRRFEDELADGREEIEILDEMLLGLLGVD